MATRVRSANSKISIFSFGISSPSTSLNVSVSKFFTAHPYGRGGDIRFQKKLNFGGSFCAFESERSVSFEVITKDRVNLIQQFNQRLVSRPGIGCDFAKHDGGAVAVLVPHKIAAAVAKTFFTAENIKRRMLQPKPARLFLT